MARPEKHYCPVCQKGYQNPLDALQCAEKYGYPAKPQYAKGQIVIIKNEYFKRQKAKIIDFAYSKPGCLGKNPHTLTYLLILPSQDGILSLTTALEKEIKPIEP